MAGIVREEKSCIWNKASRSALSPDPRVRVFRRTFEDMEVDAYAILGSHTIVLFDTLIRPADMAEVFHMIEAECEGDEVVADSTTTIDRAYYTWAHEQNVRAIVRWLQTQAV